MITIIVLIIIAGVSIGSLLGDNGILNSAMNAKNDWSKAEVRMVIKKEKLLTFGFILVVIMLILQIVD